ncbi:MAG: hypothetical protein BGO12_20540 [Verrucomicrobia bacterium 61-8]|mgnify:CR=1 FL=1|nr:hypothetical protein [Verrucomicrobiota bacterium]OJV25193.1 MAG: hypothetical protein BGO12_20540 [Verrucomicrobia bacterium 61-8]
MSDNKLVEPADAYCLVCGKSVQQGGGFCRLNVKGTMIALCCPLCMETFNQDKPRFEAKLSLLQLGMLGDHNF